MRAGRVMKWGLAAGAAYMVFACDTGGPGVGTVAVSMTDAPFPFDSVATVNAWVTRVDARVTATDSAQIAGNTSATGAAAAGWTTIATPNQSFELLALRSGITAFLGANQLAAGTYNGFRLLLDPSKSNIVLKNGTLLDGSNGGIVFPSGAQTGIKIVLDQPVTIVANDTTKLLVDFDVNNSFVMRGNSIAQNGLLFKPVVHATVAP